MKVWQSPAGNCTATLEDDKIVKGASFMNCPHCGNPISPADRFCLNCGADLGAGETIISRMPPPAQPPPPSDETIISRAPPPAQPPPPPDKTIISRMPPPAYEAPPGPPTYPTAPPPTGETGGRNTMLIVAVVLILLCCCCLIAVLAAYMLFGEDILSEISLAFSLV